MTYLVKEIYYTLQGEGYFAGRPAVMLRFAGCNLWSGREADRAAAQCRFCDTDFVGTDGPGGGRFATAEALAAAVRDHWPQAAGSSSVPYVVCTGGEPLLQLDAPLVTALHAAGLQVGLETNGTLLAPEGIDWICVSPKAGVPLVQVRGDELKIVYPQAGLDPADFEHLDFRYYFLQPMDGPHRAAHCQAVVQYCLQHPRWRVSLQIHKLLGLP
jgi:7-carboxy-7-deazaguanine synthase